MSHPEFGIMTAPQQVDYLDMVRVWLEADGVPEIASAWLFDHLLPIAGSMEGPIYEGGRCCRLLPHRPSGYGSDSS